jgi:hypothetical protein
VKRVTARERNHHVIGRDVSLDECEEPMACCFDSADVSIEPSKGIT